MENRRAAVLPSKGIGDALLMMIASHCLLKAGYSVTTYHSSLAEMRHWFPGHQFETSSTPADFSLFDLVVFQNDNLPRTRRLSNGSIFYPSYSFEKHGPLAPLDQVFNRELSMADNVAHATANLLQLPGISKDNGLVPPPELINRRFKERVVLHPFSSEPRKNWPKERYVAVARALQERGYHPLFAMSITERAQWCQEMPDELMAPLFPDLDQLARFLFESGYLIGNDSLLGHLASNMHLPTLVIADSARRMRLWRPAWRQGIVLTPCPLLPNWKLFRWRERKWKQWVHVNKVLRAFDRLSSSL